MPALSATALALVKARQQAGESQATVARLIGISPSSLSLLLRGAYPARDLEAMERRIVAALGQVHCPYLARSLLIGADLRWAYLKDANLSGVDLSDADLDGAILDGVNFTNAALPPWFSHLGERP